MKKHIPTVMWAVTFAVAALMCYIKAIKGDGFDIFFSGWWVLFILVPAVADVADRGFKATNISCILSAVLLFVASQKIVDAALLSRIAPPAVVLISAVGIVFSGLSYRRADEDAAGADSVITAFKKFSAAYAGSPPSSVTSIFASTTVDLTEADVDSGCKIDVNALFGSVTLLLPSGVSADAKGLLLVSGCMNSSCGGDGTEIRVTCNGVFGNILIK